MHTEALPRIELVSPARRAVYVRVIVALLAAIVLFKCIRFFASGFGQGGQVADFAAFHIVAGKVWLGDLAATYDFATFAGMQREVAGEAAGVMPWTYPPQFDLLLAPFAFQPGWAAYFLFTSLTLAAYLVTLRKIAGDNLALVLVILFPALATTIASGQNGFLTGALIGLFCINVDKRPRIAGAAIGMMVIKPHLAIAAGIYMLVTRRWMAIAVAATVVVASALVCTLAFGPQIWIAWLGAIKESASYLEQGRYPLFRMVSAYATLYTAGVPAAGALWGQFAIAALALVATALAVARGPSPRFALGVVAIASVMMSPYAYDYDLPIVGIGLALLVPDLATLAGNRERGLIYGMVLLAGAYGLLLSAHPAVQSGGNSLAMPAVAGFALAMVLATLLWLLLRRPWAADTSRPALASSSPSQ